MAENKIFYSLSTTNLMIIALIIGISNGQDSASSTYSSYSSFPPSSQSQSSPSTCSAVCGAYGRCITDNCPTNVASCCVCNKGYVGDSCNSPATVQVDIRMKCDSLEFTDKLKDSQSKEYKDAEKQLCKVPLDALKSASNVECFARSFEKGSVIGALVLQSDNAQTINANTIVNTIKSFCDTDSGCKKLGVDTNSLAATNSSVEVTNSNSSTNSNTTTTCSLQCKNGNCSTSNCPDATVCCLCNSGFVGDLCDTVATKQVVLNLTFTTMSFTTDMSNSNSDSFKRCYNQACTIVKGGMRSRANAKYFCWLRRLYSGSVIMESGVQGNNDLNTAALVEGIKSYCTGSNCAGLNTNTITATETSLARNGSSQMTIVCSIWMMIIHLIIMLMMMMIH